MHIDIIFKQDTMNVFYKNGIAEKGILGNIKAIHCDEFCNFIHP